MSTLSDRRDRLPVEVVEDVSSAEWLLWLGGLNTRSCRYPLPLCSQSSQVQIRHRYRMDFGVPIHRVA